MPGSKTNSMTPDEVKRAVRKLPRSADFVWDGVDEDERPATAAELQAARRGRGRPAGTGVKQQVAIRLDRDLLETLRTGGAGWQTRANDALRELVAKGKL